MIEKKIIKLKAKNLKDSKEVLSYLADCLIEEKMVKPSFKNAVLERENSYPTGLQFEGYAIALPHTDSEHVIKSQIAIMTLEKPVKFIEMASTDKEIDVKTESSKRIEPIPDFVFYEIQEERKRYEKNRSRRQHGIWVFQDLDYICCSSYGRPRSISFIYKPYKELIEKIGLPYICPHDLRHTYTTLLMKNNINQRAIAASLGHTQFETYTDEHRKEYVIADNSLNEDIYERGIETNVGDLMYGATKEAKGLLDLAEAEETFAQAGEKCVQNAIITTVQYIYKFGCEVGIY